MHIRTNKTLLKCLEECRDGSHIKDEDKQQVFDTYYARIKDVLSRVQKGFTFPDFESLEFTNKFGDFVFNATAAQLEERLKTIHHDLYEWNRYVANQSKALEACDTMQRKYRSKARTAIFWVIMGLFIVGLVATVTLAILEWFDKLPEDQKKWIDFAGIFDAAVGGLGFILERVSANGMAKAGGDAVAAVKNRGKKKVIINKNTGVQSIGWCSCSSQKLDNYKPNGNNSEDDDDDDYDYYDDDDEE